MEYGGTGASSQSGEMIGGENQSSMFKKGGNIEKLDSGVYRIGKPKKVGANLYEQKIVEIFENGDISTASDYGRKLSDFNLQKYPIITKEQFEAQYRFAKGGSLKGNQKKLDVNKNGKLDAEDFKMLRSGKKMAKGGHVSKGEMVWKKLSSSDKIKFLYENFTPEITPRGQELLVDKAYNFLPKSVKIKIESKYANVENYENGGKMEWGGTAESSETGEFIGGENQSSMFGKGGVSTGFTYDVGGL